MFNRDQINEHIDSILSEILLLTTIGPLDFKKNVRKKVSSLMHKIRMKIREEENNKLIKQKNTKKE